MQTSTLEGVQELGYRYGYSRLFRAEDDRQVLLNLFVFDNPAGARTAVGRIADDYRKSHASEELPGVEQVPVGEIPGGRGIVARTGEGPPVRAFVVATRTNIVVKVEAVDFFGDDDPGPLAVAVSAARSQLDRL